MQKVSISVDDGSYLDLKLAEFLIKIGLKAVFYIPYKNGNRKRLTNKQIRELSDRFEIGSHTYSHQDLIKINSKLAWSEILDGKKALENIIGKNIDSFAFPYGHYNKQLVGFVKKAGFKYCRSGRIINFNDYNEDDFLRHPNLQIYPHNIFTDLKNCLKYKDFFSFVNVIKNRSVNHLNLINQLSKLDNIHFWCHSEDIERFNLWSIFYSILSIISL